MLHHVVNTKALCEKFLELHEPVSANDRTTGEQVTKAQKVKRNESERNLAGIGSQSKVTRYQSLSRFRLGQIEFLQHSRGVHSSFQASVGLKGNLIRRTDGKWCEWLWPLSTSPTAKANIPSRHRLSIKVLYSVPRKPSASFPPRKLLDAIKLRNNFPYRPPSNNNPFGDKTFNHNATVLSMV